MKKNFSLIERLNLCRYSLAFSFGSNKKHNHYAIKIQKLFQRERERERERERCESLENIEDTSRVLNYRKAHYEVHGSVAPQSALPQTHSWPFSGENISYNEALTRSLNINNGKGIEIGPLNIPILLKNKYNVLYVDHLNTEGLCKKYPTIPGIVDIDRPIVNNDIIETLKNDSPLDYVLASQVLEHVPNPIGWLRDVASLLKEGGLVALSLPDRRQTFDFFREETRPSDWISAFIEGDVVPNTRAVYDHHSQASFINMDWATSDSVTPMEIINSRGAVSAKLASPAYMDFVKKASQGEYLDVHVSVFTPTTFLLVMAQVAGDGLIPLQLQQFYSTDFHAHDRRSSSFIAILKRVPVQFPIDQIRLSYLKPLGSARTTSYHN